MGKADGPFQKVRPDLPDDPKFRRMVTVLRAEPDFAAHVLGVPVAEDGDWPRTVEVGGAARTCWDVSDLVAAPVAAAVLLMGLLRVWGAVYAARSGEVIDGLTVPEIDDLGGVPGLCVAMCDVGWAEQVTGGVRFPGLVGWFGDGRVSDAALRMRKHRANKRAGATCDAELGATCSVTVAQHVTSPVTGCCATAQPERNASVTEERREKIPIQESIGPASADLPRPADATESAPFILTATMPDPPKAGRGRETFKRFWELYPKKTGHDPAWQQWNSLTFETGMPDPLLDEILAAVRLWLPRWAEDGNRYVKEAANWLRERRWKDRPPEAGTGGKPGGRQGPGGGVRQRGGEGDYAHLNAGHNLPAGDGRPADGPAPAGEGPF